MFSEAEAISEGDSDAENLGLVVLRRSRQVRGVGDMGPVIGRCGRWRHACVQAPSVSCQAHRTHSACPLLLLGGLGLCGTRGGAHGGQRVGAAGAGGAGGLGGSRGSPARLPARLPGASHASAGRRHEPRQPLRHRAVHAARWAARTRLPAWGITALPPLRRARTTPPGQHRLQYACQQQRLKSERQPARAHNAHTQPRTPAHRTPRAAHPPSQSCAPADRRTPTHVDPVPPSTVHMVLGPCLRAQAAHGGTGSHLLADGAARDGEAAAATPAPSPPALPALPGPSPTPPGFLILGWAAPGRLQHVLFQAAGASSVPGELGAWMAGPV
jgi:hypothetical protein